MFNNKYVLLFFGWFVSRFILSIFRGLEIGVFIFEPGIISIITSTFLVLYANKMNNKLYNFNIILIGIVVDSLIYSLIRQGNDILFPVESPWDRIVWIYSIFSLVFVFIFYFLVAKINIKDNNSKKYYYNIVGLSCIITIFLFRSIYFMTLNLPNDERSTIIYNIEVHHLAFGAIFIIILLAFKKWEIIFKSFYFSVLFGISVGMILDQSTYLLLMKVSDLSYNNLYSWIGAIVFGTLYSGLCFLLQKNKG